METALRTVNALISALFFICYAYQFLYIPLVLAKKQRPLPCCALLLIIIFSDFS